MNIQLLEWGAKECIHNVGWKRPLGRPKWTNGKLGINGSEPSDFINKVSYLKLFTYQMSPSKIF
jgi:hypothetical protein